MRTITRLITLSALGGILLLALAGCERLGFETETPPEKTQTDADEPPPPDEPWREPPADWEEPATDLLVYDVSTDEEKEKDPSIQAEEPTPHARIVVQTDAIMMENISSLMLRTPAEREELATRADEQGIDSIWQTEQLEFEEGTIANADREGAFKLPAVSAFIDRIASFAIEDDSTPAIALALHAKTPYARLYSVAYSIWEVQPSAILLVRARRGSADGDVFTLARASTRARTLGKCDPNRQPCAQPHVEVHRAGLQLRAAPGIPEADSVASLDEESGSEESPGDDEDAGADAPDAPLIPCLPGQEASEEGELPRFEAENDWTNRVMLLDEALCPSVPVHDDGRLDAAGLVELFNDIESMAPGCSRATWTASTEASWDQLGPVIGHASAQTSFERVQFNRPLPRTTPSPSCDDAMRPSPSSDR